jgi:2-polyprenyl-3-methyl-5-hydroxy-6-metoxy-1,4-benzoquinol methylase
MVQGTHLEFYRKHDIAPVDYRMDDLDAHLQRRGSLYRMLGLLPGALRGADVLEVAAGTGQNSLYLASRMPRTLTLVEPNPAGLRRIDALYRATPLPHVAPEVINTTLEQFDPRREYDVVICENWLGRSPHERALLRKLAGFVRSEGVLAITAISPIGLVPNILRRGLAVGVAHPALDFEQRTERLARTFGPHLSTIAAMTRSVTDWVHDNLINPAYYDLVLTIPAIVDELGPAFEIVGSSPAFAQDWRWFKALHGEARAVNAHVLSEYRRYCHNYFDYRSQPCAGDPALNERLERDSLALIDAVRDLESAALARRPTDAPRAATVALCRSIASGMAGLSAGGSAALEEAAGWLSVEVPDADAIARSTRFGSLFGRETLYVLLAKQAC